MSEEQPIREEVLRAILDYLARHDGHSWYQIDRSLSGKVGVGPYKAEQKYLEQEGRVRSDGYHFWLISD